MERSRRENEAEWARFAAEKPKTHPEGARIWLTSVACCSSSALCAGTVALCARLGRPGSVANCPRPEIDGGGSSVNKRDQSFVLRTMMVAIPASNVPTARVGTRRGAIGVATDATTELVAGPGEQAREVRRPDRKTHRCTGSPAPSDTFSAFYGSEYHAVVAFAYALTGRAAVAEELAQDAFLVTHRNWERISAYDVPGAFVRRVVANMAVSFARRLAAEARALARLAARSPKWSAPLEPPDADFWRSVRSLPRRQAQVLALRYLEDLPDDEIALILGCSSSTIRVHLHNGRVALAGRLGIATNGRSSA